MRYGCLYICNTCSIVLAIVHCKIFLQVVCNVLLISKVSDIYLYQLRITAHLSRAFSMKYLLVVVILNA